MAIAYDEIVPWGRSYEEYVRMFALTEADLSGRIIGCGDGPASFNVEARERGQTVVSCDPLYSFSPSAIERRIQETSGLVLDQTRKHIDHFLWSTFSSPEDLAEHRMRSMRSFLADFASPGASSSYVCASLPDLPFRANSFDVALCSHLLFLYSDHLNLDFHRRAIREMLRVAAQVRIYPVLDMQSRISDHLPPVVAELREAGFLAEQKQVDYEFLKGADKMLWIRRTAENPQLNA